MGIISKKSLKSEKKSMATIYTDVIFSEKYPNIPISHINLRSSSILTDMTDRFSKILSVFREALKPNSSILTLTERPVKKKKRLIMKEDDPYRVMCASLSRERSVTYRVGGSSSRGYGRLYPVHQGRPDQTVHVPGETRPRHFSAQGAPKWLRYYLYDEMNHYVDISQSLPTIESQLGAALGIAYPADMLDVRRDLTALLRERGVDECESVGKTLMLQLTNGAKFTRGSGAIWEELRSRSAESLFDALETRAGGFASRLSECRRRMAEHVDADFKGKVSKEGAEPNARLVSILCQNIERIVVTKYLQFLQERGREVTAVIHDGVLFAKTDREEAFPRDLVGFGEKFITQDTGFVLSFDQEVFEVPAKDAQRLSDEDETDLPEDLKSIVVRPFEEPPHGPEADDLHMVRDEIQMDIRKGHTQHVSKCKGNQIMAIGLGGKMILRCDDETCEIHPCGSNRPVPNAWQSFFKACAYINVQGNLTQNITYYQNGGEPDDGEVAMNPEHLEMFKSTFCYLKKPGKYYEYKTGVQYNELEFINRNKMERTVVRRYDEAKKKTVTKKYESARLWIKNHDEDIKTFYDLTYVPGGSRVLPHPEGPEFGDLLNTWKRCGADPVPNGDCSLFYEWFEMLIPDEETREWILDTMAYKYHNPAKKPGVCVQLLAKAQGIGKTFVFETMCEALFGRDSKGGTFVQLDGTKKDQFVGKFNAHLSRCDAVLIDELSQENGMGSVYEQMKKLITDEAVMTRGMFKDYVPESSYMLWIMTSNKGEGEYAIPIESTADRRQFIVRCEEGFLHLSDPSKFEEAFKRQMYEDGGMGKLVSDIKSRPLRAEDRPDGVVFKPSVVERFPEKVKQEREKAFAELRERQAADEPSEDPFFAELAKDVHDRSFTEKFLRSRVPGANGIYAFDWSVLAQNECHHETSRSLYERYRGQKGNDSIMSVVSFSRRLVEMGLFKAQKRVQEEKKTDVVWVGFKRRGPRAPSDPPSSPRLTKRLRVE